MHGSPQVEELRTEARMEAARAALETALSTQGVETANKDTLCAMAVQAAVQDGVDVNTRAEAAAGEEPRARWLSVAAKEGLVETLRALAASGAEVNNATRDGRTALYGAAVSGHVVALRVLLEAGAEVNHANNKGSTALFGAAWTGHAEVIRALLAAGAAVKHVNNDGRTALTWQHRKAMRRSFGCWQRQARR